MFFVKKVVNYVFIFQKNPLLIFEIEIWKFKFSYHLHRKGSKVFVDKKGIGAFKKFTCFTFANEASKGAGKNKGLKETKESPMIKYLQVVVLVIFNKYFFFRF